MTNEYHPEINRRKVLKQVGGTVGGLFVTSIPVSASETNGELDPLEDQAVSSILSEVGNPELKDIRTKSVTAKGGHPEAVYTEIESSVGPLIYAEADEAIDGKTSTAYLKVTDRTGPERRDLPRRFQTVPRESELIIFYDNGDVVAGRSAISAEKKALASIIGVDEDKMIATYNEKQGRFKVVDFEGEGDAFVEILEDDPKINEVFVSALRQGEITVTTPDEGATTQESHCWDLGGFLIGQGPCVECVQSSAVAIGCAGACSLTGGPGCIVCIASAGIAGGACGCCLACVDNIPGDCRDHFG